MTPTNVTSLLHDRVRTAPDHAAVDMLDADGRWQRLSTAAFESRVREVAKGLIAVGLPAGARVAIMASTRLEWAVVDMAVWYAGGVVVPIYDTAAADQVRGAVADAQVCAAFAGSDEQASLLEAALDARGGGSLGVWRIGASARDDRWPVLDELVQTGGTVSDAMLDRRRDAAGPDDVATIVYTSGTGGSPKGALITHGDLVGKVRSVTESYREVVHPGGSTIIVLPLAHVLARGLQLLCLSVGMRVAYVPDPAELGPAMAALRPTFLVLVPRALQKIRAAAGAAAQEHRLGWLWRRAERHAVTWGQHLEDGDQGAGSAPARRTRIAHRVFDLLFYRRLRARLGSRVDYLLSGGAPLPVEDSLFFRGIGLPVIEGYGLTETTAPLTGNLPGRIRSGTVGPPLPGCEVRIADDGEVLARGVGVVRGYQDPSHDAARFVDGWLRTGDLGEIDDAGHLVLRGRADDMITTATGKSIQPLAWEAEAESDPLIAQAVVIGDGRPFLSAVLVLEADSPELRRLAPAARLEDPPPGTVRTISADGLTAHLDHVVSHVNQRFSRPEQVRRFIAVVLERSTFAALFTPTQKLKRRVAKRLFADAIDDIYRRTSP